MKQWTELTALVVVDGGDGGVEVFMIGFSHHHAREQRQRRRVVRDIIGE